MNTKKCEPDMTAFMPIPDAPSYSINAVGQVRSTYGSLQHDAQGRVRLRIDGKQRLYYVGELLQQVGMLRDGPDVPDVIDAAKAEEDLVYARERLHQAENDAAEVRAALVKSRQVVAHQQSLIELLRSRIEKMQTEKPKGRPKKCAQDPDVLCADEYFAPSEDTDYA